MNSLAIAVVAAAPAPQTAAPAITFRLRIREVPARRVEAMTIRCLVRIEPRGRRYSADEQGRLVELFGDVSQWSRTLRGVTWSQVPLGVPAFTGETEVDLSVPCTYDLDVASAKYLHALRDGAVPLTFLFTGTIFSIVDGHLSADPIPWDLEAPFLMPSQVWRAAMEQFFPGGGFIRLDRDTLDRLQAFRARQALVGWDDTVNLLLRTATEQPA